MVLGRSPRVSSSRRTIRGAICACKTIERPDGGYVLSYPTKLPAAVRGLVRLHGGKYMKAGIRLLAASALLHQRHIFSKIPRRCAVPCLDTLVEVVDVPLRPLPPRIFNSRHIRRAECSTCNPNTMLGFVLLNSNHLAHAVYTSNSAEAMVLVCRLQNNHCCHGGRFLSLLRRHSARSWPSKSSLHGRGLPLPHLHLVLQPDSRHSLTA